MSENNINLILDPAFDGQPPRIVLVWASGMAGSPASAGPSAYLADLLGRVRAAGEGYLSAERKAAVRSMLRYGSYRPAGRAKPSSEYLLASALDGSFPFVNGPVDVNNGVSLEYGYPASIFDMSLTGPELLLRRGLQGENYVFNRSGQTIDLTDLLLVCRRNAEYRAPRPAGAAAGAGTVAASSAGTGGAAAAPGADVDWPGRDGWEPCGNSVKDAMITKVFEPCTSTLAVVYAPANEPEERLRECGLRFAGLLAGDCGAADSGWCLI